MAGLNLLMGSEIYYEYLVWHLIIPFDSIDYFEPCNIIWMKHVPKGDIMGCVVNFYVSFMCLLEVFC